MTSLSDPADDVELGAIVAGTCAVIHNVRRVLVPLAAVLLLAGCSGQGSDPAQQTTAPGSSSPALVATGPVPTVPNDLANGSLSRSLKMPGEQFGLTVDYWTTTDVSSWQTLQPKTINLSLHVLPASGTTDLPEVLVGSMTAVTSLAAAMPGLDALPISDTADTPTAVPGYLISADFPFDAVVPIEGYSAPLLQRWQALAGDQALTEQALVDAGVYGNRLTFTYRVLVRNKGDAGYHRRVVQDVLTVAEAPAPAGGSGTPSGQPAAPSSAPAAGATAASSPADG